MVREMRGDGDGEGDGDSQGDEGKQSYQEEDGDIEKTMSLLH